MIANACQIAWLSRVLVSSVRCKATSTTTTAAAAAAVVPLVWVIAGTRYLVEYDLLILILIVAALPLYGMMGDTRFFGLRTNTFVEETRSELVQVTCIIALRYRLPRV